MSTPKYSPAQYLAHNKLKISTGPKHTNNFLAKGERKGPYELKLKHAKRERQTNTQNKSVNGDFRIVIKNNSILHNNSINGHRDKRPAKSLDLRRKDNGNYIASIYPPDRALTRPRNINLAIEQELVDFMKENEIKFNKSQMNQNYVFPLKISDIYENLITDEKTEDQEATGTTVSSSHRRYKSMENQSVYNTYNFNLVKRQNANNHNNQSLINKSTEANSKMNSSAIKFKINSSLIKKNLKKLKLSMNRTDISKNKTDLLNVTGKIKLNGVIIGNTYDNRRIVNLDSDSLNSIYINQTISPKETVMLSHSNEIKRRPNVAKGIKVYLSLIYIKKA